MNQNPQDSQTLLALLANRNTLANMEMLWELQNLPTLSDNLMMVIDRCKKHTHMSH